MPLARVSVAFRPFGRVDPPLPEAHRSQAFPLQGVRTLFRTIRPPGAAHEAAPTQRVQVLSLSFFLLRYIRRMDAAGAWFSTGHDRKLGGRKSRPDLVQENDWKYKKEKKNNIANYRKEKKSYDTTHNTKADRWCGV